MRTIKSWSLTSLTACVLLAGCGSVTHRGTTVESGGDVVPVVPADNRTLPAGSTISTQLDQALSTKSSRAGDPFSVTVTNPLVAQNGTVVIPAGAKIDGHVTATDPSDRAGDPALIRLNFERLLMNGRAYPFSAEIVESHPEESGAHTTRNILIGGAVGAALGGLVSGAELGGFIVGGALGAAAGTIVSMGTDVNATLPAGSAMTLRATQTTRLR